MEIWFLVVVSHCCVEQLDTFDLLLDLFLSLRSEVVCWIKDRLSDLHILLFSLENPETFRGCCHSGLKKWETHLRFKTAGILLQCISSSIQTFIILSDSK